MKGEFKYLKKFEKKINENLHTFKNLWLSKLKNDLLQNRYNLKKAGLYNGMLKENIENLLKILKEDYDM